MITPRDRDHPDPPPITSAMVSLAWAILHGEPDEGSDAARTLAELVLAASEAAS